MQNPGPDRSNVSETLSHEGFSYSRESEIFTEVFSKLSKEDQLKVLNSEVKKLSPDTQSRFKRAQRVVFRTCKNAQRTLRPKRKVKPSEPNSSTPIPRVSNRGLNQQQFSFPTCPTIEEQQEFDLPEFEYDESHLDLSDSSPEKLEEIQPVELVDTISNAAD